MILNSCFIHYQMYKNQLLKKNLEDNVVYKLQFNYLLKDSTRVLSRFSLSDVIPQQPPIYFAPIWIHSGISFWNVSTSSIVSSLLNLKVGKCIKEFKANIKIFLVLIYCWIPNITTIGIHYKWCWISFNRFQQTRYIKRIRTIHTYNLLVKMNLY